MSLATGEPFEMVFPLRSAAGELSPFPHSHRARPRRRGPHHPLVRRQHRHQRPASPRKKLWKAPIHALRAMLDALPMHGFPATTGRRSRIPESPESGLSGRSAGKDFRRTPGCRASGRPFGASCRPKARPRGRRRRSRGSVAQARRGMAMAFGSLDGLRRRAEPALSCDVRRYSRSGTRRPNGSPRAKNNCDWPSKRPKSGYGTSIRSTTRSTGPRA